MGLISNVKNRLMPSFIPREIVSFSVRGEVFSARALALSPAHISKLGIRRSVYVNGLKLYSLATPDFARLCRIKDHAVKGKITGLYPLSRKGEMEDVNHGRIDRLPVRSRVMVVPAAWDRRSVVHETFHDVFLGCLTKDDRMTFYKCIGAWLLRIKGEKRTKEWDFFEEVNVRAAEEYNLKAISPESFGNYFRENDFSDEFKLFCGECFAYAGELLVMGHDRSEYLGEVPAEMSNYFKAMKIIK